MTGSLARRLPRDLHPVAWWGWALSLAFAASLTTNPWVLLVLIGVATLVVAWRRSAQPWGRSFRLYVAMAVVIVAIRVGFRIVFGGGATGHVVLPLPEIPLPQWAAGLRLLGPVTRESLLSGLYDGLRLAAIVICVGAANALANPKRLLRSLPAALYEVGTVLVVAVTAVPHLADSVQRVRAAQSLRGGPTRRFGRLRRFVVPVLEDALERSLALAAGMDTRGYGRLPSVGRAASTMAGGLLLGALCGIAVGTYALLDATAPRVLALPMLVAGVVLAGLGLWLAGRRVRRTRYRPDPWRVPEWVVVGCGLVTAISLWRLARVSPALAFPDPAVTPRLSWPFLGALLVGALPALASPPAPLPPVPVRADPAPLEVPA